MNRFLTAKELERSVAEVLRLTKASAAFYYDNVVPEQAARLYGCRGWDNLWAEFGVGRVY